MAMSFKRRVRTLPALMSGAALVLLACHASALQAQQREATLGEIDLIRNGFGLDEIPDWKQIEVLEIRGTFSPPSEFSGARLFGQAYLMPYEVQGALCVMEAWFLTGTWTVNAYEWRSQSFSYWNWLRGQRDSCRIPDRLAVPEEAVTTRGAIPSASLPFVLSNSAEILALGFDFAVGWPELEAVARDRFLAYRETPSYRLSEIEMTIASQPGIGFAYKALYRSPGESEGPIVVFSITPTGIVVHGVSHWIA